MAVFAYYANSSGDGQVNCRRLHDICMTSSWLWVNLCCYPCKHESDILSRCFKCPPCLCRIPSKSKRCNSVAAFLTNFGGMVFHWLAVFSSPAVTNWISRVFGGNHNLCHICRGYILERESFYRVKSWMIETPFPETYCENPGAELWNAVSAQFCISSCASAWSWKLWSRSAWSKRWAWNLKRLWFEAVFVSTWRRWTSSAAGWQEHRPAPMGETENANTWHMWRKQDGTHPLDWAPKANHELWNDDRSILFYSCPGQMKYCKVQHRQLTLGQFVLLPMQGWKWPVLEMLGIPGTCLSRHWITAMNVCDSGFDRLWHGAKLSHSLF